MDIQQNFMDDDVLIDMQGISKPNTVIWAKTLTNLWHCNASKDDVVGYMHMCPNANSIIILKYAQCMFNIT